LDVFSVIEHPDRLNDPLVLRSFGTAKVSVICSYPTYLPDDPMDLSAAYALFGGSQRTLEVHLHNDMIKDRKHHDAIFNPHVKMTLEQFYHYASPPFEYAMNVLDLACDATLVPLPLPTPHLSSLRSSPLARA
jgi:hypothetical protein